MNNKLIIVIALLAATAFLTVPTARLHAETQRTPSEVMADLDTPVPLLKGKIEAGDPGAHIVKVDGKLFQVVDREASGLADVNIGDTVLVTDHVNADGTNEATIISTQLAETKRSESVATQDKFTKFPLIVFYDPRVVGRTNSVSPSTIAVFQKYITRKDDSITFYIEHPQEFKNISDRSQMVFPYFPDQIKEIIAPNMPVFREVLKDMAPTLLTKGRDFIQYDPEAWTATPVKEYDPTVPAGQTIADSIRQCADMAHQAGYRFSIAPQFGGSPEKMAKPNPFTSRNFQAIDWKQVDRVVFQIQGSEKTGGAVDIVKQMYQHIKSHSPNTQVFVQTGLTKRTDVTPTQIVSYLTKLYPHYDGIQIIFLPNAPTATDDNLEELLYLLRDAP